MLLLSSPMVVNPEIHSTVSVSQISASKQSSDAIQESGQLCLDVNGSSLSSSEPAIALLMPLDQDKKSVLFTQGRISRQHKIKSTGLSLGVGQRLATNDRWWLGYNFFYDARWEQNHHSRLGIGLEARKNYLTLALNGYYPLSGWKDESIGLYAYRPAQGIDVTVNAYLPHYPQLGMMVKGEHYFDKPLTNAQKAYSPSSLSVALHYTPVPLLTAGYSYQIAKHDFGDQQRFHLSLNYRLGMTLKEQLDSTTVAHYRQLTGSQLEPVQRSYQMVLASQFKSLVLSRLTQLTHKINPQNLALALEHYDQEVNELVNHFLDENTQAGDVLVDAVLRTVCEYNGPKEVILSVLNRVKEIQQMGSWDNLGGEATPYLVVLGASWPRDSRLVIESAYGTNQTYGQGNNEIRIQHAAAHYRPIINNTPVEAGGDGNCLYHSILHILGNNSLSAVRNLRNEVARSYLENPTIKIMPGVVEEKAWDLYR
ncbi:MAG: inverse autotransporter beta domain-containing protein [Candidatus Symbiodolus clandestinus]